MNTRSLLFLLILGLNIVTLNRSYAKVFVKESFVGYPNNGAASGIPSTGLGFTGLWDGPFRSQTTAGVFEPDGLKFGAASLYESSGGRLRLVTQVKADGGANCQIKLADVIPSGVKVLWLSYLFATPTVGGTSVHEVRFNRKPGLGKDDAFLRTIIGGGKSGAWLQNHFASPGNGQEKTGGQPINLDVATTYLVVSKFENVGEVLDAGVQGKAKSWILSPEQYARLINSGVTEEALDNVTKAKAVSVSTSGRAVISGSILQISSNQGGTGVATTSYIDEIKLADSLADLIAVKRQG
jgi:hypothetical protein